MTTDRPRLLMPRPVAFPDDPTGDGGYRAHALPDRYGDSPSMLELRLATGNRVGLPYAWLSEVTYDPSTGITLAYTTGAGVTITGRRLGPVYAALVAQQAVYVREADPPTAELLADGVPVVESIRVDRASL